MWVLNVSRAYPYGAGWARLSANRAQRIANRRAFCSEDPRLRNADVCSGAFFLYCFYVTTARAVKYVELR